MKINGVNIGDISYQNITSSKGVNNTISEELSSQVKGMSQGIDNGEYTKGLIGIAEGSAFYK